MKKTATVNEQIMKEQSEETKTIPITIHLNEKNEEKERQSLLYTILDIEDSLTKFPLAHAVLQEIQDYFVRDTDLDRKYLLYKANHISRLIYVASDLIVDIAAKLEISKDDLYEYIRKQK